MSSSGADAREFALIQQYHRAKCPSASLAQVDDKTWADLDLEGVFTALDQTRTTVGQQYLYHLLRSYEAIPERLRERFETIEKLLTVLDPVQSAFRHSRSVKAYDIPFLLFNPPIYSAGLLRIFIGLSAAFFVSCVLAFLVHPLVFLAIFLALTNAIIAFRYRRILDFYSGTLSQLNALLGLSSVLARLEIPCSLAPLNFIKASRDFIHAMQKKVGWLVMDKSQLADLAYIVIEYLNVFGLIDLILCLNSFQHLNRNKEQMILLFEAVGSLDAFASLARFLATRKHCCHPVLSRNSGIILNDLCHPLVPDPIPNTIEMSGSIVITGSNMTGKTTFVKALALNLLLSQTVGFCLASKAIFPPVQVKTSIRRGDKIDEGKSYFLVEIDEILEFIRLAECDGEHYLFVVDEIFRGTNTVERIAAATAVLSHLASRSITIVTTHDIELCGLLEPRFQSYHFSEDLSGSDLYFDYRLRKGPATTRNAIRLLGVRGYPPEIVQKAEAVAANLANHRV